MRKLRGLWRGSARASGPSLPVDLADPALIADPAPTYAWLRAHQPVARVASGGYLLSRHADIVAALSNPSLGNAPSRFSVLAARNRDRNPLAAVAADIPPFQDKPAHVATRRALSAAFFGTLENARGWVDALAADTVAPHHGRTADLVADVARPFACRVMARFVGLPEDPQAVKSATQGFFHLFAPITDRAAMDAACAQVGAAVALIGEAIDRGAPAGSLLSRLIDGGMARDAAIHNALLVLADGVENVEAAIAMCFAQLAPLDSALTGDTLERAVTEALRLSTPGQIIPRVAAADTVIHGVEIKAGMPLFLALGSANLDPDAHPQPLDFRPDRTGEVHLAFGRGRHGCIGAPLALLQITAMLGALRDANARRTDSDTPRFHPRFGHRWPVGLGVTLRG